jgi:dihydroorotate dehydrogenase
MGRIYAPLRRLLFLLPAEFVHRFSVGVLRCFFRALRRTPRIGEAPRLPRGIGLAAGFVKHPRDLAVAAGLGFDFVEAGTLTRYPQGGNPQPRLFRLPLDRAILNRMGFNNPGIHAADASLRRRPGIVTGINIGKGKRTPAVALEAELREAVALLTPAADFFVVNLSSPNTPGLRALLEPALLDGVLVRLRDARAAAARFWQRPVPPLLLKLHPDLEPAAWAAMLAWLPGAAVDGVVFGNTTVSRSALRTPAVRVAEIGAGGVSGEPLWAGLDERLRALRAVLPAGRHLIAAGGIDRPERVRTAIAAGADAVEIYTALIYEGPSVIGRLRRALARP